MEKIKIKGLPRIAGAILGVWGAVVACKALYDLFAGEPEANIYSPAPWQFVSQEQWLRYGGFELAYGLACAGLAWWLFRYSRLLPEWIERPKRPSEISLFE